MKRLVLVLAGITVGACGGDASPTGETPAATPSATPSPSSPTTPAPVNPTPGSPAPVNPTPGSPPVPPLTSNTPNPDAPPVSPTVPTPVTPVTPSQTPSTPVAPPASETASTPSTAPSDASEGTSRPSDATTSGLTGEADTSEPSEVTGCGGATVCDDFESGLASSWVVQPNSTPPPSVDTGKGANGSSASLKVQGTSQQAFVAVPVPGQSFFFRAYMNFEQSTEQMNGHGWFVVGADNITQGDEQQMRFGSSGNHGHKEIDFNVYGGSCGGEKTQFSDGASDGAAGWNNTQHPSFQFSAGTWYCVEGHFNGPANEFQLWIDDAEVPGLHVTASSMCASWSPTYTHIKFGAGANSDIGAIWYDDVAVSTERIGCK